MNDHLESLKRRWLEIVGAEPASLDELALGVIQVINSQPATRSGRGRRVQVAGLSWNIEFTSRVSNSHECPINGVTNWGNRNKGAPTYYPGWSGRVWVRYAAPIDSFGSDPWRHTLTYTGTGGFGGYHGPWEKMYSARWKARDSRPRDWKEPQIFSWDFRFFLQDWPALARSIEAQQIVAKLSDRQFSHPPHQFLWQDPEILALDKQWQQQYADSKVTA